MREFAFGQQYAWMLVIFSVMVVYCITNPLVTPFGKSRNVVMSRHPPLILLSRNMCSFEGLLLQNGVLQLLTNFICFCLFVCFCFCFFFVHCFQDCKLAF